MFQILAGLLAFFYAVVPNYAVAIALLTLTVMVVLSPLTLKSTRSMLAMQKLQPEIKRLQQKYKGDRQQLNQEMMALYKEHQINPLSGCLPMLVQLPVLFVMYQIIRGLTRNAPGGCGGFDAKYLDRGTELFRDLCNGKREMVSFGVDLARSASEAMKDSVVTALPFLLIVGLVILVQYYQSRQMARRNPQASQSPQMQMMTRVLPVMFGVFSFAFPAGLNVYFLVSGLLRVAQQGAMYRWDPSLAAHSRSRSGEADAKGGGEEARTKEAAKDKDRDKVASKDKAKAGKAKAGKAKPQPQPKADRAKPKADRAKAKVQPSRQDKTRADGTKSGTKPGTRPKSQPVSRGKATDGKRAKPRKGKGGDGGRPRKRRAKKGR